MCKSACKVRKIRSDRFAWPVALAACFFFCSKWYWAFFSEKLSAAFFLSPILGTVMLTAPPSGSESGRGTMISGLFSPNFSLKCWMAYINRVFALLFEVFGECEGVGVNNGAVHYTFR